MMYIYVYVDRYIPVAENAMEFNDEGSFLGREAPTFKVRSKIVYPSESATLSTSL